MLAKLQNIRVSI